MTRTRGTARKMASLVPTDMFLIYRGRRPPTTPGGGHFGPAVAGRMTARPVSGRAVPAKALAGLGADRLELRALLGTQDREQLLAGLVADRFHARLALIVDRLHITVSRGRGKRRISTGGRGLAAGAGPTRIAISRAGGDTPARLAVHPPRPRRWPSTPPGVDVFAPGRPRARGRRAARLSILPRVLIVGL